jgi:adenine-specific DNA methylase
MTHLPKRLIEVDLPIRRISEHARREKSIRHGHISTLHIWWARRPLAACRAVLCASLWPDPADPHCPPAFVAKAKEQMLEWTSHESQVKLSGTSRERFNAARKDPAIFDNLEELRMALLDFIADFANWDNSTDPDYLATSRALTQCAHEALGGIPGTRPLVVDPFAGGGSIPLEALRVGADAFASDLNPIPVLLNKVILEYIPKYGQRLADEVRKWGQWIKEEAEKELAQFYPKDEDGSTPIAYLWARTIISEDPGGGAIPVEVPLMRSLWLSKKPNNRKALRWVRDGNGKVLCDVLDVTYANGKTLKVQRPRLEIFAPAKEREVEGGTVARGSATCPVTGYTTPVTSVRKQMKERKGGASDARLFCVVTTKPGQQGRFYRLPVATDVQACARASQELECRRREHRGALSLVPDEPTPDTKSHRAVASVQLYGMEQFGDLFTNRQLLAITTLVRLSRKAGDEIRTGDDAGLAEAVVVGIAAAINTQADSNSSLCAWRPTSLDIGHTFGRQAIPMLWDFVEGNIFSGASRDWMNAIKGVLKAYQGMDGSSDPGHTQPASADAHPMPDDTAQCFFTDPPYYDAVPYADLSDFFYVWFKRSLGDQLPELFSDRLTNKTKQAVVNHPNRAEEKVDFESKMGKAMAEGWRILAPNGIGCIVFAHKSTAGWEAQLQAMVDAGWTMTASWPIDTEMGSRMNAMGTASLASSVHLVVRPRATNGHAAVGDWRDVLEELPKRIHAWLPRLAKEGVVGADAIFACLGPALEIYSRYDSVEKASGEVVTLREYLEHVWAAVSREALSSIVADSDLSGFESDARLTAMWLWTVAGGKDEAGMIKDEDEDSDEDDEDAPKKVKVTGFTLEYDAARKIAQGLGANLETMKSLVEVKGDKATLLSVGQRTEYLFGKGETEPATAKGRKKKPNQMDLFAELFDEPVSEDIWQEKTVSKPGETVIDRVHQAMILFAAGRSEALKRFLVDDGAGIDPGLWKLAQALSALYPTGTHEKRWVDGVLARKKGLGF